MRSALPSTSPTPARTAWAQATSAACHREPVKYDCQKEKGPEQPGPNQEEQ